MPSPQNAADPVLEPSPAVFPVLEVVADSVVEPALAALVPVALLASVPLPASVLVLAARPLVLVWLTRESARQARCGP